MNRREKHFCSGLGEPASKWIGQVLASDNGTRHGQADFDAHRRANRFFRKLRRISGLAPGAQSGKDWAKPRED
jgi:hypothetical protein